VSERHEREAEAGLPPAAELEGLGAAPSGVLDTHDSDTYTRVIAIIVAVIAVGLSTFHLWTSVAIAPPALKYRAAHVLFVLPLTFLLIRSRKSKDQRRPTWLDLIFAGVAALPCIYIWVMYDEIVRRIQYFTPLTTTQLVMGTILLILVLEGARRAVGLALPIIGVLAIAYAYFGRSLPAGIGNRGFTFDQIMETMYLLPQGLFGTPTGVSARFLVIFILFGAFLTQAGAGTFFTDLASSLVGDSRGGIAKVSVLSSSLFGTVSGASVANVAVTGTFTIPAMIRAGFPKHIAGAIESVASSGGSLMPPVMGAAAFLVVEFTGIPYAGILKAAFLPALLYYISIFAFIHHESVKRGIMATVDETPPPLKVLRQLGHVVIIPTGVMIYMILQGYTPTYAAFVAIALILVASWLRRASRIGVVKFFRALYDGGVRVVPVAMACVCAGVVTGVILMTGIGLKMSTLLLSTFGHSLFLLLLVTMVAAIVLGMGMPSPAAYVICATLLAPALVEFGVPVIAAHLFVFYFAILSTITPPVALSAFTASSISGANPMLTGVYAFRYGIVSFIIPYIFAYRQELLLIGHPFAIGMALATGIVGVIGIATAMQGYWRGKLHLIERVPFLVGSVMLVMPGMGTNLAGGAMLGLIVAWRQIQGRIGGSDLETSGSPVSAPEEKGS
jgi:TRAP transporter 4TM/12TM fusion protein